MVSTSTDDVLEFSSITCHIDLALDDKISGKQKILNDHELFLRQCKHLHPTEKISLHIHKAPAPYENTLDWFRTVFANGTAAAAFLGASLLSTATVDLDDHGGIRSVAATGAVLFILLFLLCAGGTLLFAFSGSDIARHASGTTWWSFVVRALLSALSITLQGLLVAGVCCLFWVLKAYVNDAGLAGFAITIALGVVTALVWFKQTFFSG